MKKNEFLRTIRKETNYSISSDPNFSSHVIAGDFDLIVAESNITEPFWGINQTLVKQLLNKDFWLVLLAENYNFLLDKDKVTAILQSASVGGDQYKLTPYYMTKADWQGIDDGELYRFIAEEFE